MRDYRQFGPEELAADPFFQQWKLAGNAEMSIFWNEWITQNPDRRDLIEKASLLLAALSEQYGNRMEQSFPLSDGDVQHEIGRLRLSLNRETVAPVKRIGFGSVRFAAAASIVGVLGLLGWYLLWSPTTQPPVTYTELVAQAASPLVEITNTTNKTSTITLPDRSTILVYPKSRISYPKQFAARKREVYLDGKAFFTVTKNPERPFYVYANSLTTRVLGTSFTVQTDTRKGQVNVWVRTGRVSVYRANKQPVGPVSEPDGAAGVVLTPNQQVVFSPADSQLKKSLVANPVVLTQVVKETSFRFTNTPIGDVFSALERAYGVSIRYDASLMRHCFLTASLTDESFCEKLDLICRTVDANYEEVDGQVRINAKGCDE